MYYVFTRTWWIENPSYPNGLEPHAGKKRVIKRNVKTYDEARQICKAWNAKHDPGRYSLKAEFDEQ